VAVSVLVAGLLAVGCGKGGQGVTITGQVLQNGSPLQFLPKEDLTVGFSAEPPGATAFGASAPVKPPDATFTLTGRDNKGIPPGQYSISLSSQIYGGDGTDRFAPLFNGKKPFIVEVGPEKGQHFLIDVGTMKVTKR
jgi:hypothetical protein